MSESILAEVEPAGYPSATILDSRRLTGPNRFGNAPGAVLEVAAPVDAERLSGWRTRAAALGAALGWGERALHGGGDGILFMEAPVDGLMTATEVAEEAWAAAERGAPVAAGVVDRLRAAARAERDAARNLAGVHAEALRRGIGVTFDDELLTVGSGAGALSWPLGSIPTPGAVPWAAVGEVPTALVTGSNGKTTTARLLAAMWCAAGRVPGISSTDGVWVGDQAVLGGDYSGPAGARAVLRDPRVQAAVLETARGGILRRGLAVSRADAAIITNVSADHFGQYGVETLEDLARAKAVVARAVTPHGWLVLNADDPTLAGLADAVGTRLAWFSRDPARAGAPGAWVQDGHLVLSLDGRHELGAVAGMPLAIGGAAAYNVQNLLGAALLGALCGVPLEAIRATLTTFGGAPGDNPGRLQLHAVGGVTVLIDYAHNPDGMAALCRVAAGLPAARRLLVLGQAGDRPDEQIRALVRAACAGARFDRVVVKEMTSLLRGRAPGEVPRLLLDELARLGVSAVEVAGSELEAVRRGLAWSRPGDLLVVPAHAQQAEVLSELERLRAAGWRAQHPFPADA